MLRRAWLPALVVGLLVPMRSVRAGGPTVGPAAELSSPAGPGSGEPFLAHASGGRLLLSWFEPAGAQQWRLRLARSTADGWSEPQTVAESERFFVNWADFPSVLQLAEGRLAVHWLEKIGADPYAYAVRLALSSDAGQSWSEPQTPHRDGTATEHGFVSMWPEGDAGLGLVWLDGRDYAGKGGHDGGEPADAETALRTATLRASEFGPERVLDSRVCDCCQTAGVRTASGVLVAYRDRSPDEVRDIWLVRRDGESWTEPYPAPADGWQIAACPVNGPALAASGDRVVLAWFTGAGGKNRVRLAFSTDGGATFGMPVPVDGGRPAGRVDVELLEDGSALVSWIELLDEGGAEVRVRRVLPDGTAGPVAVLGPISSKRASGFPRMLRHDGGIVVAWTDVGEPSRLRLVRAALPPQAP